MTAPAHASLGFRLLSDYITPMRSEDRLSVIGIVIGFAGGAAVRRFPTRSQLRQYGFGSERSPDERSDIRGFFHFLWSRISLRSCGLLAE
jgi:hypothetical protein